MIFLETLANYCWSERHAYEILFGLILVYSLVLQEKTTCDSNKKQTSVSQELLGNINDSFIE